MAQDTPADAQSLVIYEVFTRQHGPSGTFAEVERDLGRIRGMGVDVVWLMPIHPIGRAGRLGSLGSSYAIADYRAVNPEYGTIDDFARLVDGAHALGLRVMIDAVFNHTALDAVLVREHPEWYHRDAAGVPVRSLSRWPDVIDLRHPQPALTAYLIETLLYWVRLGVDGFRCDVASLVPLPFWREARRAVAAVKPGVLWLAESVHAAFVLERRAVGAVGVSDGELHEAFDLTYDYDLWPLWQAAVLGIVPTGRYLEALRFQAATLPAHAVKLRGVENHDQPRISAFAPDRPRALAWTAFQAFNRGAFLIYAGQEAGATRRPSHVERDPIAWGGYELQPFLAALATLKKDRAQREGEFRLLAAEPALQAAWLLPGASLYGVFNTAGAAGEAASSLPDGDHEDLLGGPPLCVRAGKVALPASAAIVRCAADLDPTPFYAPLLDFRPDRPR